MRAAYSAVPVIYMSDFTEDPKVKDLHHPKHGFAFIGKPFQVVEALLETVNQMLNLSVAS